MFQNRTTFAALQRLAQPRMGRATTVEFCELCRVPLRPRHRHLLELAPRKIWCACEGCALRFEGVIEGRFKLIPCNVRSLPNFEMSEALWEDLSLPIELLFIYRDSRNSQATAVYPSPAGGTESLLPGKAWERLVAANASLSAMESDVEALLINRIDAAREYFLAPIDRCFELVGLMRTHWRGLAGGERVSQEIDRYFQELRAETGMGAPQTGEVSCA